MNMSEWERLQTSATSVTDTMKVPGGWLFHRKSFGLDRMGNTQEISTSMCFVPEPDKCNFHNEYTLKVCQSCLEKKDKE